MTPTLPVLLVHGALIAKALVVLFVVFALAGIYLVRRALARRRARTDVAQVVAGPVHHKEGPGTLRGRLHGSASTLVQGDEQRDARSEQLWLDFNGQRIELVGPVRVRLGSKERVSWFRAPRGTAPWIAASARRSCPSTLRMVSTGDEVLVSGILRCEGREAGHRQSAARWTLTGAEYLGVCAVKPDARPPRIGPYWLACVSFCLGLAGFFSLRFAGNLALEQADQLSGPRTGFEQIEALSIAAAMPGTHDEALRLAILQVDHGQAQTEERLQLRLFLDQVSGRCTFHTLLWAVRLDEALAAAKRCGTAENVAIALLHLGHYEQANDLLDVARWPYAAMLAAIGSGDWNKAATASAAQADLLVAKSKDSHEEAALLTAASDARCRAALFRFYAGHRDSFEPLRGANINADAYCAVLAALTLPMDQQANALMQIKMDRYSPHFRLAQALVFAAGEERARRTFGAGEDVLAFDFLTTTWLAPFELAAHSQSLPETRAYIHGRIMAIAVHSGDILAARRELPLAIEGNPSPESINALTLAVKLLDPSTPQREFPGASQYIHPGLKRQTIVRRGDVLSSSELRGARSKRCTREQAAAIRAAQHGDGLYLAGVLERCPLAFWGNAKKILLGVLPLVTSHREELARAVRWYREHTDHMTASMPFSLLEDVAIYRDAATAIGDVEDAKHWRRVFDRHAAALSHRERLIAFLVLE